MRWTTEYLDIRKVDVTYSKDKKSFDANAVLRSTYHAAFLERGLASLPEQTAAAEVCLLLRHVHVQMQCRCSADAVQMQCRCSALICLLITPTRWRKQRRRLGLAARAGRPQMPRLQLTLRLRCTRTTSRWAQVMLSSTHRGS